MPNQITKKMPTDIPEVDLARLAAFIDGEGSIGVNRHRVKGREHTVGYKLKVDIANTDPRLMVWLKRFGVGSFYVWSVQPDTVNGRKRRTAYRWTVRSREAVELLTRCLPYFVMKRDQAELAIAFGTAPKCTGYNVKGQFLPLSAEVIAHRDEIVSRLKLLKIPPQEGVFIQ